MNKNRIKFRNKVIRQLEDWHRRGSLVFSNPRTELPAGREKRFHHRLIWGIGKDGKTVLLYPLRSRKELIPKAICEELESAFLRGAIVGTVEHIGDAWDTVFADESQYKRKKKTFLWQWCLERYEKRKNDGEE